MKVVKSIQNLYNSNFVFFKLLKTKVDEIISHQKNERWHYESRLKKLESFALKIETGRFDNNQIFEDFFASTIVVKNLNEIAEAQKFTEDLFILRSKRPPAQNFTSKDAFSFPFDDLRLYVSLKDLGIGDLAPNLYDLVFEVQIKTFLQHAWSIATHDLIYKSDKINWGKERVAYQVKAALEHAELTISAVEELSNLSEIKKENKEVKRVNQMIRMILEHWKPEDLPSDRRRLAQNINTFIDAVGISLSDLNTLLKEETSKGRGVATRDLSPYLVVVQSIFYSNSEKIINYLKDSTNKNKQKILITSEMSIPDLGEVIENKIVKI